MTYPELVAAFIQQGDEMLSANSKQAGLHHESKMDELHCQILEVESQTGFPMDEDQKAAFAKLRDWEANHGAPIDNS